MNHNHTRVAVLLAGLALSLGGACAVTDADIAATSALTSVSLTASSDRLAERVSDVAVTLDLGYTSSEQVTVTIFDGDVAVFTDALPANSKSLTVEQTVPLMFPDVNVITVVAEYYGQSVQQSVEVEQNPAILSVALSSDDSQVTDRQAPVSGAIELGYLPASNLDARILDNDVVVWAGSVDSTHSTSLSIDETVPLLFGGDNVLTLEASVDGSVVRATDSVTVPAPVLDFSVSPAADTLSSPVVEVSGEGSLGYLGAGAATLTLSVDGAVEHTESFDAGLDTALSFDVSLPVRHEGTSDVTATLSYDGGSMSDGFSVELPAGVQSFALVPASDTTASLATQVTGTATLGYTSDQPASAEVYVDGALAWSDSFDVSVDPSVSFDTSLPLSGEGDHDIVGVVRYGDVELSDASTVTVPPGIGDFSMAAAASTVDVFEVGVSGSASLGYVSDQAGDLLITVEGQTVYRAEVDGSGSTAQAFDLTIPLVREGDNAVVTTLTYGEQTWSDSFTVTATPPEVSVTMPSWSSSYSYGSGTTVSGTVSLSSHPDWATDSVAYSTDGGVTWSDATSLGSDRWSISVTDPDIGDTTLLLDVQSSNLGHTHHTWDSDVFSVDPQFDCGGGSDSMLPDKDMVANNKTEVRTMMGYWGDPSAGHTLTFVMTADVGGDTYINPGETTSKGVIATEVKFNVDKLDCNNRCNYDLDVYVDGTLLCSQSNFGRVEKY